jgi:hypothetical protein
LNTRHTYSAGLPGSNATVTLCFDLDVTHKGLKWYALSLRHSHAGTVNVYERETDTGTLRLVKTQAVTPGTENSFVSCYVEPFRQVVVQFVNGGSAQTTFEVNQVFSCEEPGATSALELGVDSGDVVMATGTISGAGTVELVAAQPGFKIVVWEALVTNSHATTVTLVTLKIGASTPSLTHAAAAAGGGWRAGGLRPVFKTDENTALNAESSAAATVQLTVWYSLEAA